MKIEKFYQDLQAIIDGSYKNVIVMGYFNGHITVRQRCEDYVIRKYGLSKRSKNESY